MGKHAQTRPRSLGRQLTVGAIAAGLVAASASAAFSQGRTRFGTATPATSTAPPATGQRTELTALTSPLAVPKELIPPDGNVLSSVFTARGTQVYTCTAGSWKLIEPAATLSGVTARPFRQATAVHYRGPSWQSVDDGSLVTATVVTPSAVAGSIPQLLLKAVTTRGPGTFGAVTYVQRLATSGGVAPAGTCTEGVSTGIAYRAVYRFFVAARPEVATAR